MGTGSLANPEFAEPYRTSPTDAGRRREVKLGSGADPRTQLSGRLSQDQTHGQMAAVIGDGVGVRTTAVKELVVSAAPNGLT